MNRPFELLHRAHAATWRRHDRVTRAELGVSPLELGALGSLGRPRGPTSLARALHIDPAAATRRIEQLLHKGLVERRTDPNDGRRRTIVRTRCCAKPSPRPNWTWSPATCAT